MKKLLYQRRSGHLVRKIGLKMKLSVLIFFSTLLSIQANDSYSQETRISLHMADVSVERLLEEIESSTEFRFVYRLKDVDLKRRVSIQVDKETIEKILNRIFKDTKTGYEILDRQVFLLQRRKIIEEKPVELLQPNYGFKKMLPIPADTLRGIVLDDTGTPLIGVNLQVKGTNRGSATDFEGKFEMVNVDANAVLVVSYVGYQKQEVSVGGKMELNIILMEDSQTLDEVVVVGYGVQKKVNMTGAVDVISNSQIENRQSNTVSQILQGLSPGLTFTVGSNGFEPGASLGINIRGVGSLNGGSPYVLIDGFPGNMDRINPEDIESISVLKDAAASAIYGARAPYGVILITTKSGRKNEKFSISYSGNVFVNTPDRLPNMLDSYTFARVMNEMGENGGGRAYASETIDRIIAFQNQDWDYLKQFVPNDATHYETIPSASGRWAHTGESHANYDWYDDYYGHSVNQRHNFSLQGGSEKTAYYLSAGVLDQNGVLNYGTDTYKRFNLNGKVSTSITDWLDVRYETRFMKSPRERFNSENGSTTTGYDLLFRQITRTVPTQAKYDGYGNITILSKIPAIENRGTDLTETTENWHALGTVIRPMKGWKINADFAYQSIGVDRSNRNFSLIEPYADGRLVPLSFTVPNRIEQFQQNNSYWVSNMYTSYDWQVNPNNQLFVMLGTQFEYAKNHLLNVAKTNLIVEDIPSLATATGDVVANENLTHWSTQGYFTRITYNYKEKYLFEANARYDGTSRFQESNRWGFFPSFSIGWNIDRESFWESIQQHVNSFKIRGSWGQLGNQQVAPYQDLALIPLQVGKLNWIFNPGETRPIGYTSTPRLVSPYLTWETATSKNLGLNLTFFDYKLKFDFDLYERITEDMIGPSQPLAGVLGSTVPRSNNATLRTRGWETSIRWDNQGSHNDFSYFVGLNVHDTKSVVTDYLNPSGLISDWYAGKEVGEIWGYTAHDLFKSQEELDAYLERVDMSYIFNNWNPGDLKYQDTNGDGVVDAGSNSLNDHGDLSIIGNNRPRYQFGLSAGITYKEFDISFLVNGTAKRDYFFPTGANNIRFWGVLWLPFTGMTPAHLDYFRDSPGDKYTGLYEGEENINTDAYWPKGYLDQAQNAKNRHASTRYLLNGAYMRLQNLQLGYTLPQHIVSKMKIQNLRVYLSGENIFTLTSMLKGIDPVALEGYGGGAGATYGVDKIFSMGLKISL